MRDKECDSDMECVKELDAEFRECVKESRELIDNVEKIVKDFKDLKIDVGSECMHCSMQELRSCGMREATPYCTLPAVITVEGLDEQEQQHGRTTPWKLEVLQVGRPAGVHSTRQRMTNRVLETVDSKDDDHDESSARHGCFDRVVVVQLLEETKDDPAQKQAATKMKKKVWFEMKDDTAVTEKDDTLLKDPLKQYVNDMVSSVGGRIIQWSKPPHAVLGKHTRKKIEAKFKAIFQSTSDVSTDQRKKAWEALRRAEAACEVDRVKEAAKPVTEKDKSAPEPDPELPPDDSWWEEASHLTSKSPYVMKLLNGSYS